MENIRKETLGAHMKGNLATLSSTIQMIKSGKNVGDRDTLTIQLQM